MRKTIDINLYAYGNGSHNFDCEKGADVLKNALEKCDFARHCHFMPQLSVNGHHQQMSAVPDIAKLSEKLAHSTQQSILNKHFFITLGGDHTLAIGSWSGAVMALQTRGLTKKDGMRGKCERVTAVDTLVNEDCERTFNEADHFLRKSELGLIWFDAHMDSHTFETTSSNNIHGMPLAVLLGHGEKELTHILSNTPKIKPENVVLIGVRSFESGEAALLKKLGVKIFYRDDLKKLGVKKVIQIALDIVTRHTENFGISIDLDGFDPIDAPGVGTPAPDGVRTADFLAEFKAIAAHPKLIGADIAEFNPVLDVKHKTKKVAIELVHQLINQ